MQAERSPVLGVTVAVVVLCLECVGLLAYRGWQQDRADVIAATRAADRAAAEAVRQAKEARAELDKILRELDALDAEIAELVRQIRLHRPDSAETRRLEDLLRNRWQQRRDQRWKSRRRELDDILIEKPHRPQHPAARSRGLTHEPA